MSVPSSRETVLWLMSVRCASSLTRAPDGSSASASSSASARSTDASVRPSSLIARGTLQPPPVYARLAPIGNALAGTALYRAAVPLLPPCPRFGGRDCTDSAFRADLNRRRRERPAPHMLGPYACL